MELKEAISKITNELKNDAGYRESWKANIAMAYKDCEHGDKCPKCGAVEVEAMTPRTVYACGSSDYDQRQNTFSQSEQCRSTCH